MLIDADTEYCPDCGFPLTPRHAHYFCERCGYVDTCCSGAPLPSAISSDEQLSFRLQV